MSEQIKQEISQLEERRCRAMETDDHAALEALFSDDLMYTHSNAKFDTKATYLGTLRSGAVKYKRVGRSDIEMQVHGDAVFVTGKSNVVVRVAGEDKNIQLRYSNVWLKQNGQWRFALWHATPLPRNS